MAGQINTTTRIVTSDNFKKGLTIAGAICDVAFYIKVGYNHFYVKHLEVLL